MSQTMVPANRFWQEFSTDVAQTLSDEQRGEIERALGATSRSGNSDLGDLRLSFKWFFLRFVFGPEKRSAERIKQEQEMHPAMSPRNVPMLASVVAGYVAFWVLMLVLLTAAFTYFVF